MLILAMIVAGMAVGWIAQLVLGRQTRQVDWTMALVAGIVGSFVGGLVVSLLSGDGIALKPSGIIGSLAGAILVTLAWQAIDKKRAADSRSAADVKPWD